MTGSASTLEKRLEKAFKEGLALGDNIDYLSLEFAKSAGWDSIAHLHLIAALEVEFDILIETHDMLALNSYIKAQELVKKYDPTLA